MDYRRPVGRPRKVKGGHKPKAAPSHHDSSGESGQAQATQATQAQVPVPAVRPRFRVCDLPELDLSSSESESEASSVLQPSSAEQGSEEASGYAAGSSAVPARPSDLNGSCVGPSDNDASFDSSCVGASYLNDPVVGCKFFGGSFLDGSTARSTSFDESCVGPSDVDASSNSSYVMRGFGERLARAKRAKAERAIAEGRYNLRKDPKSNIMLRVIIILITIFFSRDQFLQTRGKMMKPL